jgi:hypothetical protein
VTPPADPEGSTLRLIIGSVLAVGSVLTAVFGFVTLIRTLEGGGYGTPAMRQALMILGAAGAGLGAGVATIIWDISKRYENK